MYNMSSLPTQEIMLMKDMRRTWETLNQISRDNQVNSERNA